MKRITFFVTSLKEGKIVKLIREVDKVACNIEIDFEKNIIVLSDLNEDMLETCVDLVNSCYKSISKIKIDNDESSTNKSTVKRKKANISKSEKVLEKANVPKAVKKENTENVETAIRKTFETAFDMIGRNKTVEEDINYFLDEIGLGKTAPFVFKSFLAGVNVKKINYESILLELKKDTKNVTEEQIKAELRKTFDEYILNYPDLKGKYPKISIINFIKAFVKTLY